ncbi:MAG: MaoC family dehydratase [Ktedonobacteraceae bacterium]
MTRYFEDFHIGDTFDLGSTSATQEEIIAFAQQFDPQPFHTDPEQAKHSAFGTLVASGWHTVSLFMRLLVDGLINETISLGSPGVDEVRWRHPVHPDEILHGRFTVLDRKTSKSRTNLGIIRSRCELLNSADEVIMSLEGTHFFGRRPPSIVLA